VPHLAPIDGVVAAVKIAEGQSVDADVVAVVLE